MELYILSKQDLSILSIAKVSEYEINLDEETNAKSTFVLMKTEGLKKDNFLVLNGLYRQFLFIIDDVQTEKGSNVSTVTALDISNIFDRKVIEKNTSTMTSNSIEQFIANTMSANFVNSNDPFLNIGYIDIYWHTNTQANVATNAENGLYNFHTFLINCRQYKNIYTDFKFEDGRLKIDIENKTETTELIDTTLPEVTDYIKIYDDEITAKVTVLIREDNSEYNLYLKTDRTTTTNVNDPNRANGKIKVISVDTADMAAEEALNVMKGNNYKHLVEFKIAKTSQLMDITKLHIGRPIRIKTDDDIYDSYISAITLTDENFVYFKSGSLRNTLIDKLKANQESVGNKVDISGGKITGTLDVKNLKTDGLSVESYKNIAINANFNDIVEPGIYYSGSAPRGENRPISKIGVLQVFRPNGQSTSGGITTQTYITYDGNEVFTRGYYSQTGWSSWKNISPFVTFTDLNVMPLSNYGSYFGVYIGTFASTAQHIPEVHDGTVIVQYSTDNYIYETAIMGTSPVNIYTRAKFGGVWGEWNNILPVTVTNSNGTAVKFPDGTMIQTGKISCASNGAAGVTLPVRFIDTNYSVTASAVYRSGGLGLGMIITVQNPSVSQATLYFRTYVNGNLTVVTNTNAEAMWTAIGRWK